MRKLLRDLSPGQAYAIRFRVNDGVNLSEWSAVQRLTATSDTVGPGIVQNLKWQNTGSSFIARWDKVLVDANNKPLLDFRHYRVNISHSGLPSGVNFFVTDETFELTRQMNQTAFGTVQTALTMQVWGVDMTYNESPQPATATLQQLIPPIPSMPILSQYMGLLNVTWNGLDSVGDPMPDNVSYVEVHASTTSNFTPSTSSYRGRIDYGGGSFAIVGLPYGVIHYVRLVAVNLLGRRSGSSTQSSGTSERLTGLEIENGSLSKEQINFTALDIGGANAYYQNSAPTVGMVRGDVWYDTDDKYTTYRYNGTAWLPAPEVGVVTGTKIIAGTITGDRIATNFFQAARAYIGTAYIDEAMIATVNAASIRTGSLAADGEIIAGDINQNHARMTSSGFYVKGPGPDPGDGSVPPIVDRIRMGTGVTDFFAIPDPAYPDATLAQIDENGSASFQSVHVVNELSVGGRSLNDMIDEMGNLVAEVTVAPINGLNPTGAQGIRSEYGIAQFSARVVAGRTYEVSFILNSFYQDGGTGRPYSRMRFQTDLRTAAQIEADSAPPTPCTINSTNMYTMRHPDLQFTPQIVDQTVLYRSNTTGIVTFGLSLGLLQPEGTTNVVKVLEGSTVLGWCKDLGPTQVESGAMHDMGGTLYQWTEPAPPKPVAKTQYYKKYTANWIRSYQGSGGYMSNATGRAYQGLDPSGYNGNQVGYLGWSGINFVTLLNGATVDKILLYIYFSHWYYNAGGTARVGYHNVHNDPGSANRSGTIAGTFDSPNWPKPGGRKLNVTTWANAFKSGAFRGVALGPGNNSYVNYGYATSAYIEIWYTK